MFSVLSWGQVRGATRGAPKKLVYLKSHWDEHKTLHIKILTNKLLIFDVFCAFMGWVSREGCNTGATKKVSVP